MDGLAADAQGPRDHGLIFQLAIQFADLGLFDGHDYLLAIPALGACVTCWRKLVGVEPTCDALPHAGFEDQAQHRPRLASNRFYHPA